MTNLYQELRGKELYQPIEKMIEIGKLRPVGDKIKCNYAITTQSPWVVRNIDLTRKCHFYQEIVFQSYKFIHSRCHSCYKVVVRPKTLNQLMILLRLQEGQDVPCKCGIEVRPFVFGNYGGYYYTDSIEEGRERYKEVRKMVDEHLSDKVAVILKRGCTEFEMDAGPSDKWIPPTKEQLELEKRIDEKFITDGFDEIQCDDLKAKTVLGWIEFAFDRGDETYKNFTGGQDMGLKPVTYHE